MEEIYMGTLFLTTVHYSISPNQDIFTKHLLFLVLGTVKWVKQIVGSNWSFKVTIPLLKATIIPGRGWGGGQKKPAVCFQEVKCQLEPRGEEWDSLAFPLLSESSSTQLPIVWCGCLTFSTQKQLLSSFSNQTAALNSLPYKFRGHHLLHPASYYFQKLAKGLLNSSSLT